ncbi:MAG: hypothetical protein ACJ75H_14285 [Thermoanaerobaculia bacterium]
MNLNTLVRSLALAMLLLAPPVLAAKQETPKPPAETPRPTQSVRYDIRYLNLHAAEVLAWDACIQKERCQITTLALANDPSRRGYLDVTAEAAVQEKVARALAKQDTIPRTQNLQILLLTASTKAGGGAPDVPENAQKALTDLKKFLPYKSFQMVDAALLSATEGQAAQGRLVTSGGFKYEVKLRFRAQGDPEDQSLFVDRFELQQELIITTKDGPHYDRRSLIETAFNVKEGETIVVGTSKADGVDEALVVLLTVLPRS